LIYVNLFLIWKTLAFPTNSLTRTSRNQDEHPTSNVEWEKAVNREPLNRERLLNSFAVRLSVRLSSRRSQFCLSACPPERGRSQTGNAQAGTNFTIKGLTAYN